MREMIYTDRRIEPPVLLERGTFKNHAYAVVSLGTHPCAYIESKSDAEDYNDPIFECLDVNGGPTYFGKSAWDESECKYVGWDYAHCWDYCGGYPDGYDQTLKARHTTREMVAECKRAIVRLAAAEKALEKVKNES